MPLSFRLSFGLCLAALLAFLSCETAATSTARATRATNREVCATYFGSTKRAHVHTTTITYTAHARPTVIVSSHSTDLITPSASTVFLTATATTVSTQTQSITDVFTNTTIVTAFSTVFPDPLTVTETTTATSTFFSTTVATIPTTNGFTPIQSSDPSLTYFLPKPIASNSMGFGLSISGSKPPVRGGITATLPASNFANFAIATPRARSHVRKAHLDVRKAVPQKQLAAFNQTGYPTAVRCRVFTTIEQPAATKVRKGSIGTSTLATPTQTSIVTSTSTSFSTTVLTADSTTTVTATSTEAVMGNPSYVTTTTTAQTQVTAFVTSATVYAQCETANNANYANGFNHGSGSPDLKLIPQGDTQPSNFVAVGGTTGASGCCSYCASEPLCGLSAYRVNNGACSISMGTSITWVPDAHLGPDTIYSNGIYQVRNEGSPD